MVTSIAGYYTVSFYEKKRDVVKKLTDKIDDCDIRINNSMRAMHEIKVIPRLILVEEFSEMTGNDINSLEDLREALIFIKNSHSAKPSPNYFTCLMDKFMDKFVLPNRTINNKT